MNIPQRARELTDEWVATLEKHAPLGKEVKDGRTGMINAMILAFAADVERDTLERAAQKCADEYLTERTGDPTDIAYDGAITDCLASIRALIATPTPERPDPTTALALLFQNLFHNWSDKTETAMIAAGLLSEEDAEPTALGHEALRIAKENDHG